MVGSKQQRRKVRQQLFQRPRLPSVAEQDAIIESLRDCSVEQLIERLRDEDYRYMLNDVFNCWNLRTQIRVLRLQRGWTQEELARRSHLHQAVISRLEHAYAPMDVTIKTLLRIAHAFDVCLVVRLDDWGSLIKDILNKVGNPAEALKVIGFNEWLSSLNEATAGP